jgi:hypothetical protein
MAVEVLRDGTPVIASGGDDTVRVWRLADGTPLAHPLDLSEPVWGVALHGNIIVTAVNGDIEIHSQPLHDLYEIASSSAASADRYDHRIMAGYPVHGRADASTAMLMACNGHTSTRSPARPVRQRWLYEYVAHRYKQTTTLGTDIGRYREQTSGERDNQTFGA